MQRQPNNVTNCYNSKETFSVRKLKYIISFDAYCPCRIVRRGSMRLDRVGTDYRESVNNELIKDDHEITSHMAVVFLEVVLVSLKDLIWK